MLGQEPQQKSVPGLGDCQQSPGEPWPEPGNSVSSHGCPASGAQGTGLGLWHWWRLGPHLCPGQCHQGTEEHVQGSGGPWPRSGLLLRPILTWRQGWFEPEGPELSLSCAVWEGITQGPTHRESGQRQPFLQHRQECQRVKLWGR